MSSSRTKVFIFLIFIVALAAGTGAGLVLSRHTSLLSRWQPVSAPDRASLAEQLDLSPEQREQMRQIWETARQRARTYHDDVEKLQKGRDHDLVALLSAEQKAKYEQIAKDYADRFSKLVAEREAMFDEAVHQTRKILSPAQREQYEQILRNRVGTLAPPARDLFPTGSSKSSDSVK